jgi:Domain of unknown function (DUF4350)
MKKYVSIAFLIVSAAVLVLGILELFNLRFQVGDVYPEYSSMRSDPLGTMAFYESLEKLPGLNTRRDLSTTSRLPDGAGTTYFHIAAPVGELRIPENIFKEIELFAAGGGRFVITIYPLGAKPLYFSDEPKQTPKPKVQPDRWQADYEFVDLAVPQYRRAYESALAHNVSGLPLPATVAWHSGIVFKNLGPDWKPIYVREGKPVMIERTIGRGSIVIATDSFFLSNEALLLDRHTDLLMFLIGPNRNVVFDEAHLGITETPGMATLMRRYRLYWVGASLILLAILFIWKMSTPLMPLGEAEKVDDYIAGKDTSAGIVNLLRRSIPPGELLATCFSEWKKSAARAGAYSSSRIQQAETAFEKEKLGAASKQEDTVRLYREISRILQRQIQ